MPGENNNLNDKVTEQLVARNEELQNENTVMKGLLKELDSKVSKFESMDLEGVEEILEKYESLGTPEALQDALNQLDALAKKSESDDCDDKDDDYDDEDDEDEKVEPKESISEDDELSKQLDNEESNEVDKEINKSEGNDKMSKELEDKVVELEKRLAEAEELNAKYKSLGGTPEEISDLLDEVNSSLEPLNKLGSKEEIISKLESYEMVCEENRELTSKVESFEAIGSVEQVSEMFEELKSAKLESAADNLSKELNISKEQALLSINKFESVEEAREFLTQVLPSKASASKATGDEAKHESEEESVVTDEFEKEGKAKNESTSETNQYSNLKNLLKKL